VTGSRAAAFLLVSSFAAPLRADLTDDADKLAAAWSRGGHVTVLTPRFPVPGETTLIALPPDATTGDGDGCTTVAVLGAASTTFAVRISGPDSTIASADSFLPSVAGAVHLVRCGAERRSLGIFGLQMRSPHGVIETVVATSERPLIELRTVLPHRDPGAVPPATGPGPPPPPAALDARIDAIERIFSRDGVSDENRRLGPTDASGSGQVVLDLPSGCHRLFVLSVSPGGADMPIDIDADLIWANGAIAASDRTDSPDASLLACTGERRLAVLAYGGSASRVPVMVFQGRTEIPRGLPPAIGPDAQGRMAKALFERHVALPSGQPIYASLGVSGLTELPIEVEPGRCYVAMVSPIQGETKLLALDAEAGARYSRAHSDDADSALVAAFCAGGVDRGKLEVEAHGRELVWIAALWSTAQTKLGEAP
jgi:hypothetical protein